MGYNLQQYRNELRIDLKDSGALWSNPELNRCVQKAVDDLSRFMPLEKVYDVTFEYDVDDESFTSPATAGISAIANAQSIDIAPGGLLTITAQPDVPRPLRITIVDADNSTYQASFIITGTDKDGIFQTETFNYSRGGSKTLIGTREFKTVYEIELDTDYGSHAGDTAAVGYDIFTEAKVYLANKPIKPESEIVTNATGTAITLVRDSDYYMDYANGAIKSISEDSGINLEYLPITAVATSLVCNADATTKLPAGTKIRIESEVMLVTAVTTVTLTVTRGYAGTTAATHAVEDIYIGGMAPGISYLIDYDKSKIGININDLLPVVTRIQRVQYPADVVPQQFVTFSILGDFMYIGSQKQGESQTSLSANKHIHIYYEMKHTPPGEAGPGSYPDVLDEVMCKGSIAYALLMKALQYEHQAVADIAYVDMALDKVTTEMTSVDTQMVTNAEGVWASEVKHILTSSGIPGIEDFLELGDDKITTLNVNPDEAELYRRYAETAGMMAQLWAGKRTDFLSEAARYIDKGGMWIAEAQNRIANVTQYLQMANRWQAEGIERRNEFWAILRDKSEYRKRTSSTPVTQPK